MKRRPIVAVIGSRQASAEQCLVAEELGRLLVEAGLRVLTGGLEGVMQAACRGARAATNYREGDTLGILPGSDVEAANPYVDIAIASGLGHARNVLVVQSAQAVVAVGGGAGTLSELALAWQNDTPIVALEIEGVSGQYAGRAIDERARGAVHRARTAEHAVSLVRQQLS